MNLTATGAVSTSLNPTLFLTSCLKRNSEAFDKNEKENIKTLAQTLRISQGNYQ